MTTYTLDPVPLAGSEEIVGTLDYALRRKDRPETVICYLRLPDTEAEFLRRLFNAQAEKAWNEGAEAMCGQDNGGPMAENPYTVVAERTGCTATKGCIKTDRHTARCTVLG